jgi:hypothetical protein
MLAVETAESANEIGIDFVEISPGGKLCQKAETIDIGLGSPDR